MRFTIFLYLILHTRYYTSPCTKCFQGVGYTWLCPRHCPFGVHCPQLYPGARVHLEVALGIPTSWCLEVWAMIHFFLDQSASWTCLSIFGMHYDTLNIFINTHGKRSCNIPDNMAIGTSPSGCCTSTYS